MKAILYIVFPIILLFSLFSCKEKGTYVSLDTTEGEIIIKLYDETPAHKENFVKLVEDKFYDGVLFHRVIDEFMIQTGDPDSKNAQPGEMLGAGGPDYTIPSEINDSLIHIRGAVGAARDNNPEKRSSSSQFYIVEGKTFNEKELNQYAQANEMKYSSHQREEYETIGGTPYLDNQYTVFGQVVVGMDVVDKISNMETNRYDRPVEDVRINTARIVKYKE